MNKIVAKKIIFNIIISLLFIIDLILVIISFNFETTANLEKIKFILVVLEIILALVLVSLDYIFKIKKWINTIVHNVIIEIQKFVSNKFEKWAIQLKAKLNTENEEYHHLAPTFLEKSKYVSILKSQIDNPHIKNMAISGPYGSGKSSIIHTFQLLYPQYKCLNLSLAAFALKEFTIEKDTKVGTECMRMEELEYSLVQQFFYHVKAKDIPDSRFGRIRRWNWLNKTIATTSVLLFILCSLYLIKPNWLETIIKDQDFFSNSYLQYTCIAISGIILFYATYKFVSYIHKFNGGRVKLMNYEIELQKDIKTSIFNRYLDELVYLFQTTKYEIVILEDLDRFDNTNIFARLRELNTLLNQSQDIGRRIVFIYALSDSVFEKSIERTKFFDFILPIIPHTNSSNSADQFVKILGKLVDGEDETKDITKNFIKDIAPFISDLRTIKAIVTEYKICSPRLNEDLPRQNLLAIIIYKNLYPKDFEKIYEGKGKIVEAFKNKLELVETKISSINEDIIVINNEIEIIENETLRSIDELKSVVVASLIKEVPENATIYDSRRCIIYNKELFEDENINKILSNNIEYYKNNEGFKRVFITNDFDYKSRIKSLKLKSSNNKSKLYAKREKLEKQLSQIGILSMKQLCSIDETIVPSPGDDEECTFLNFLIRRGYIDEKYYNYITIFTEGILTKNDHDYLLSIKCNTEWSVSEMLHALEYPKLMLDFLIPQDYLNDKILNIYIVDAISKDTNDKSRECLINKITKGGPIVLEFIKYYLLHTNLDRTIINGVIKKYNKLWSDIEDHNGITPDEMLLLSSTILKIGDIDDLVNLDCEGRFSKYLSKSPLHMYLDIELSQKKLMDLISKLNIKVRRIITEPKYQDFAEFLYFGNYYEINQYNIWQILGYYGTIDVILYKKSIYTAVLEANINSLINLIEEDIEHFIKECVLSSSNTEESESTIVLLLNNDEISSELKNAIIEHNETIIENVEDIKNIDLRNKLYSINKVKPSLLNIAIYLLYNNIDEIDSTLLKFINSNSDSIINCIKNSEENDIAIEALLKKDGVIDDVWQEIFINRFYRKIIKENLFSLRSEQFLFYIDTEEKADLILGNLDITSISLMKKVLNLSNNKTLKMKGVTRYLENNPDSDISCINELITTMGEDFAILTSNKGGTFEIDKSPEAENFVEQLFKNKLVSKKRETKTKIKVLINK